LRVGPLTFRHIAQADARGEVSGHYHPKAHLSLRGRQVSRPAFLRDARRLILPAYGTYTGGLRSTDKALTDLMATDAQAILTGPVPTCIPMPR
jgi:metallophosphoesterase superfamily enzyme